MGIKLGQTPLRLPPLPGGHVIFENLRKRATQTNRDKGLEPTQRLQVRSLRILLNVTLVSMLVLVASLFLFMYRKGNVRKNRETRYLGCSKCRG
jgi:hypothetical protein